MCELKECPICGSLAQKVDMLIEDKISHKSGASCSNKNCCMYQPFYIHDWQSRPIEDRASKSIAKLREEMAEDTGTINVLRAQLETANKKLELAIGEIDVIRATFAYDADSRFRYWLFIAHIDETLAKTSALGISPTDSPTESSTASKQ